MKGAGETTHIFSVSQLAGLSTRQRAAYRAAEVTGQKIRNATMTVTIQGEERDVDVRDRSRGFRIRVHWASDEGDSETGKYYATRYLSNKVDLDDGEYIKTRQDVTHDVIEEAIETILEETAQDDAVFEEAEVWQMINARRVK